MPGPFYFAWVNALEAFDPVIHTVWNDDIYEADLDHVEGSFATLRLKIRNPRIGLLAPGRKRWAWFSWFNGADIVPLFYGRLLGVPEEIQEELVEINFIARPDNYASQKAIIAEHLREYETFDPIWFSQETMLDPDNVLEALPLLWAIDRITHEITTTDIVNGEDGMLTFGPKDVLKDSVHLNYGQNPLRRVTMTASVSWQQQARGGLDITRNLLNASGPSAIRSYTGKGLADSWPKDGQTIGGGWSFFTSNCTIRYGDIDPAIVGKVEIQGAIGLGGTSSYVDGGFDTALGTYGVEVPGQHIGWSYHVAIPEVGLTYNTVIKFDANRRKQEELTFTLEADVQPILSEPDDQESILLTMSSSEVVAQGAILPSARSYFTTARGTRSLEYLISIARTHLIARSRAVNIAFDVPFLLAVNSQLSTRKNVVLLDPDMPGGVVAGKITRYNLSFSDGKSNATIYAGCTVGRGGFVDAVEGDPDYVDDDYVGSDYQFYNNRYELIAAGTVAYQSIEGVLPNDDGVDFDHMTVDRCIKEFSLLHNHNRDDMTQQEALSLFSIAVDNMGALQAKNTEVAQISLKLVDLTGGPFITNYNVGVTELKIPKTVDLEAGTYE